MEFQGAICVCHTVLGEREAYYQHSSCKNLHLGSFLIVVDTVTELIALGKTGVW